MHGVGGRPGWAWIFILEGLATVIIGVLSLWMVHDFPDEAGFLSAEDRLRVYYRLKSDQQASAEHEAFKWTYAIASLKDWKTYTSCLIFMGAGGGLYAFSLFLPTSMKLSNRLSKDANSASSCRARLQENNSTTHVCTTLRSSGFSYRGNRIHRRQDTAAWIVRNLGLLPWNYRFRHFDQ